MDLLILNMRVECQVLIKNDSNVSYRVIQRKKLCCLSIYDYWKFCL